MKGRIPRCVEPAGNTMRRAFRLACAALVLAVPAAPSPAAERDYDVWLKELQAEARQRGFSEGTVAQLVGVEPRRDILDQDRSQPRKPEDFCGYMRKRLTPTRIARARRVLVEQHDLLAEIVASYGVPARYLVALWGLETNFGDYQGDHPVIPSLVTLAYDPRRKDMFREQVFAALRIVEEGNAPEAAFNGSWAGALGQVQFMPTTFLAYAVDYDGDGRKDLWGSVPDALASAAHYLRQSGWSSGETWGRQVRLPDELVGNTAALKRRRHLSEWRALGLRTIDDRELPVADMLATVVLPRRMGLPAFLAYRNYRVFLSWNRSTFFAVSVGTFADEISDSGALDVCGLRRGLEGGAAPDGENPSSSPAG